MMRVRPPAGPALLVLALTATLAGCGVIDRALEPAGPGSPGSAPDASATFPLAVERAGHRTSVFLDVDRSPAPTPPAGDLELVRYRARLGENVAYVTPAEGARKPAIVWIAGGFDWGIGDAAWEAGEPDDDQSATVFRQAGIVEMYPALRGSNGNAGRNECMLGEVDDIIAAARFLRERPDVDPDRVYLGGHSTGGTLALLTVESTDLFRAVIAFGPASSVYDYDECDLPSRQDPESQLRAPVRYITDITSPTWIIEGEDGNAAAAVRLGADKGDAPVTTVVVPGLDHFSVLQPGSKVTARQILADSGDDVAIAIDADAVATEAG
jgi:acetyl esterase/lipase